MVNSRKTLELRSKITWFMVLALLFAFLSGGILSNLIPENNYWAAILLMVFLG